MSIDGFLNLNKHRGLTSSQAVVAVRRLIQQRKVGHGGTLDPEASGVLPLGLGQGTRLLSFVTDVTKVYRAQVMLGVATDTYDATGQVVATADPASVTREQVEAALASFRGTIEQVPPAYSALKEGGTPFYRLAREGLPVPRRPRQVEIYRIELMSWEHPSFTLEVECSKGTYIRSLAHDLGQLLGCGAHLMSLERTRSGPFSLESAVSLEELRAACDNGRWQRLVYPLDYVILSLGSLTLCDAAAVAVRQGQPFSADSVVEPRPAPEATPDAWHRAYSPEGRLLALVRCDAESGLWHPAKVFAPWQGPACA